MTNTTFYEKKSFKVKFCFFFKNFLSKLVICFEKKIQEMNESDRDYDFYLACVHGEVAKVKQMIKFGVKLNRRDASGRTLLHDSSVRNNIDIVRILVQSGANEYVKDSRGRTPLMYAAAKGHYDIVKYLIERNTFRIPVITNNGVVMVETHEYLNTTDDDGRSCLMYACGEGHSSCVQFILNAGADVNLVDSGGRNALMYACREGYTDLVQLLIDHGISVNCVSNVGWSALHYSCLRGHYRLVKLLLDNKIDVNIENNMSNTAAYFAFKSGNVEIVKLLLEYGLQVSTKDVADILWLIKFWTAFVQGTAQFTKYEQFISCLCELIKYKTLIDENNELTLCLIETVYRTYMRQKYDLICDKNLRNIIKYLLKLSVYAGHIEQSKLLKSSWFNVYFNLSKYSTSGQQYSTFSDNLNNNTSSAIANLSIQQSISSKIIDDYESFKNVSQMNLNNTTNQYNDNNNNVDNNADNDENAYLIYKEFRQLLIQLTYKPPSLMSLCRKAVRKQMPLYNRKTINQLQLPIKLHQYLQFNYL